jgi:monofunctional glycosyltransferase
MTPLRLKTYFIRSIIFGALLINIILSYMYFSHDVERLSREYPFETGFLAGRPKHWVNLNDISKHARWAIILSEDWAFYQHQGFDVEQIKIALQEMRDGNRFRGASTITQQMVKNVFLTEERTLWRKLHEFILTFKAERALSKNRILEIYLNIIEFGPNIYGIKKASYHYFGKAPKELNPREAAFLAMLLPSPKRYYISFKKKKLTPFAKERINAILVKMRIGKVISPEDYELEVASRLDWETD